MFLNGGIGYGDGGGSFLIGFFYIFWSQLRCGGNMAGCFGCGCVDCGSVG